MTARKGTPGYDAQRATLEAQTSRVLALRAAWVAQVEEAATRGATVATVATATRIGRKAVTGRLRRAGRRDLISVLVANARPRTEAAVVTNVSAVAARRAA